jgi:prepilin peptidase CpaA
MLGALEINQWVVVVLGVAASWCDLRTKRIPNLLTFGGAALAIVYSVIAHGLGGLWISVGGWLVGAAVFMPFFALGGMGAGDVKLLACLGAWLGPAAAAWVALYAAVAGGVMAVGVALATGYLSTAIFNTQMLLMHWRTSGLKPMTSMTLENSSSPRLPYALPIAAGAIAVIWLRP